MNIDIFPFICVFISFFNQCLIDKLCRPLISLDKFIPGYFILYAIVNETVFFISLLDSSLLGYRNTTPFLQGQLLELYQFPLVVSCLSVSLFNIKFTVTCLGLYTKLNAILESFLTVKFPRKGLCPSLFIIYIRSNVTFQMPLQTIWSKRVLSSLLLVT